MNTITLTWIATPFFLGFIIFIVPKLNRHLTLWGTIASAAYGLQLFLNPSPVTLNLLDSFGIKLIADELSAYFILTNAIVTAAVALYCWRSDKTAFFYAQMIIVHGSLNAAFVCADFISLYVALEVSGIAAFLLIAYPRSDRSIWVGLRYLFVSNTAMLFYLVGAALVYQTHHSFSFTGLKGSPPEALALIFLGLLIKAGIFVSGLWLPLTHSESETPVSALMSGIVVKASVLPLLRTAFVSEEIDIIVRIFGVGTALMGVSYTVLEKDTKRLLAFSTISQLGWILAAPAVGGFYALTHGLVKSSLFLIAGSLPSRNFKELQYKPIHTTIWIALVIASLSISGFPLLSGFAAKSLSMKNLASWQFIIMNIAALGTAISFAKFIFLPHSREGEQKIKPGFWISIIFLITGLIVANIVYPQAYNTADITKALITIAVGWLAYHLIFKKLSISLPRVFEEFEHLVGVMGLTLILLFWMALP
ncbi:cation:proton antiporter [Dolichospermum circinale]|uniref:cation:proton antiporter n=1 Tax=Dolichospermum circinale TaxID=109265 RepID=UPI0003FE7E6C|nr:cation:proton antiporter [Dolichospermum circinale]MDB9476870.1 cation:proton antiporter [Dolichospermum circinale CS-537/11]MDB9479716.1 cation:proton antiporter [Dolichospermum circinale CS-537/03]MDB9484614.1 cation:proton antiporter [Dolichospermum circinale CS-537/05]